MAPVKKIFLFPGHTVKLGMGRREPGLAPDAARFYPLAEKILGFNIYGLMLGGPPEMLKMPSNLQPAVFLASFAALRDLAALGVLPDLVAGRSLGDLTAVAASGALSFEEGLALIRRRGEIFEKSCARSPGRMSVLLGLTEDRVAEICAAAAASTGGVCVIAGINTVTNFVISGTFSAVEEVEREARAHGAHVMDISMPGPFHSPLMKEAELEFSEVLAKVKFAEPCLPIVDERAAGGFVAGRGGLVKFLTEQICTAVNWKRRVSIMGSAGAGVIFELGPSQGMARIASEAITGSSFREVSTHSEAVAAAAAGV